MKLADVTRHYADEWPDMIHEAEMLYDDPLCCCNYRNYLARRPGESALGRYYRENGYYCAHFKDAAWRDDGAKVMAEHRRVLEACADLPGIPAAATALVRVLRDKIAYEADLLSAWKAQDRAVLGQLAGKTLPALIGEMKAFNEIYRTDWYATSRPFGFETIQKRNAGALARLEEAKRRLDAWLGGAEQTIPELDEAMKPFGRFSPNSPVRW